MLVAKGSRKSDPAVRARAISVMQFARSFVRHQGAFISVRRGELELKTARGAVAGRRGPRLDRRKKKEEKNVRCIII